MQSSSSLARIQQTSTLFLIAAAGAWVSFFWDYSITLSLVGAGAILLGYALVLACQFALSATVGWPKPDHAPSVGEFTRAWLHEAVHAARVFAWRQPFRWRAVTDSFEPTAKGKRGVVFVHGFLCNRGFWIPWMKRLHRRGQAFVAVNLEPVFGSMDVYAPIMEDAVQRMTRATGMAPILVCHSMGGVIARSWLTRVPGNPPVHLVVTIGSPHRGTWLARFSAAANARQLRLGSEWLCVLEQRETEKARVPFTCWYSNCDNIVFPVSSATLEGADNRLVRGAGHVDLAFRPEVMDATLALAWS